MRCHLDNKCTFSSIVTTVRIMGTVMVVMVVTLTVFTFSAFANEKITDALDNVPSNQSVNIAEDVLESVEEEIFDIILEPISVEDVGDVENVENVKDVGDVEDVEENVEKPAEARSILIPFEEPTPETGEAETVETLKTQGDTDALIPFNPAAALVVENQTKTVTENATNTPGMASIPDSVSALRALFQKHRFPYGFIEMKILHQNAHSRVLGEMTEMELPLVISFRADLYAKFQQEVRKLLEAITISEPFSVTVKFPYRAPNPRKNVYLNVQLTENQYAVYLLPADCREVLSEYAALLPIAELKLYGEKENALSTHRFPLLYRDIVKAYPINLMGVYYHDYQTIRIYPHQEMAFSEFIQAQGTSFIIPERFTLINTVSANQEFLQKNAKNYFLESSFRRSERLPEIPYVVRFQVPTAQFQQIRFMSCQLATEAESVLTEDEPM